MFFNAALAPAQHVEWWYFGKKDREQLPIYDIGFRFHLTTYVVHNLISLAWFEFGFASTYERRSSIVMTAIIWGVFLFHHAVFIFWTRKKTIKGLDKENLFD